MESRKWRYKESKTSSFLHKSEKAGLCFFKRPFDSSKLTGTKHTGEFFNFLSKKTIYIHPIILKEVSAICSTEHLNMQVSI